MAISQNRDGTRTRIFKASPFNFSRSICSDTIINLPIILTKVEEIPPLNYPAKVDSSITELGKPIMIPVDENILKLLKIKYPTK